MTPWKVLLKQMTLYDSISFLSHRICNATEVVWLHHRFVSFFGTKRLSVKSSLGEMAFGIILLKASASWKTLSTFYKTLLVLQASTA